MHSIRLRGPWEYQPLARAVLLADGGVSLDDRSLPPGGTLVMPADWGGVLGDDYRGLVRFTRRFAQPTGLDGNSRVWLVVENVDWQAAVSLNGHALGHTQFAGTSTAPWLLVSPSPPLPLCSPCPVHFDITALLQPRNELSIEILFPEIAGGVAALSRPGRENLPGGLIGLVRLEIETAGAV
jgi:hypothetical protein